MITDRLRWSVIEANTEKILAYDLIVLEPEVYVALSGPSRMAFKIPPGEAQASASGIDWKNWGQWVVCDIEIDHIQRVLAYGIVTDNKIDPDSGVMLVEVTGPIGYPKGIPWLENFNPIAVDPFEVVQRIWAHLQSTSNSQLNINAIPASSGTQMLPGYGFDGSILSFDFFAMFIRAVDMPDCGDVITGLSRDIPFDMFEEASWDANRTELTKNIRMAYPFGGLYQQYLRFALGENVKSCEKEEEMDIEPVTDVIIRSWIPGKVYSSELANADPTRLRRVVIEEDAYIDSTERSAAWAKRKLTRRNVPFSFKKIVVIPDHPNAPFGSYNVGDTIIVEAENYPWHGDVKQEHRVVSIAYKEAEGLVELGLKVEGAFNYDPIEYDPDWDQQPTEDPNLLSNGYFSANLSGWKMNQGQWFRVATVTYDTKLNPNAGSVRVDCDDSGEYFESHRVPVEAGHTYTIMAAVRYQEIVIPPESVNPEDSIYITVKTYKDGGWINTYGDTIFIDGITQPQGAGGWHLLQGTYTIPTAGVGEDQVNELSLELSINLVDSGITWWTYCRILP